jgi:acyl-CoA reductase-like NAD-dependent aldehyde dehydrogenase
MSDVQFAPAVSDDIRLAQKRLSMLDSIDSGKPINEMIYFDIPFTVDVLRYYAGWPTKITGGTKESGWGRETCRETLEEYRETKTVVVSL